MNKSKKVRYINGTGYAFVPIGRGQVKREHTVLSEKALGRTLPPGSVVHHVNHDRSDNRPSNLVICGSHSYHMLLHRRERALIESGHADWLRCRYCKTYDAPENLFLRREGNAGDHRYCMTAYQNERRQQIRKSA